MLPNINVLNPLDLAALLWPHVYFYKKQRDILWHVENTVETYVVAGNMLGKDFVSGYIALWFFLTRQPCRVVTTSADYSQLESVLWGEIRNWIQTSRYPLEHTRGGPLLVNHLHIRRVVRDRSERDPQTGQIIPRVCPISYMIGRVAAKGEGMLGHHVADIGEGIPNTMFIADEASGVEDIAYERAVTWAKRVLAIGNPYPCSNFFFKGVTGGDVEAQPGADLPVE